MENCNMPDMPCSKNHEKTGGSGERAIQTTTDALSTYRNAAPIDIEHAPARAIAAGDGIEQIVTRGPQEYLEDRNQQERQLSFAGQNQGLRPAAPPAAVPAENQVPTIAPTMEEQMRMDPNMKM